ncbi:hypothetical protein CQW39_20215 [Streptomyces griseofuscus]|nr:hypothetical protein CQW39_20215 [Streptomyces griseofuscus]
MYCFSRSSISAPSAPRPQPPKLKLPSSMFTVKEPAAARVILNGSPSSPGRLFTASNLTGADAGGPWRGTFRSLWRRRYIAVTPIGKEIGRLCDDSDAGHGPTYDS